MTRVPAKLRERLARSGPLLLDGATGTELERRGHRTTLPLWSARALLEAPQAVLGIHRDYVAAGAQALTANTFRTQRRTLARGGLGARAAELTALAVELAREAAPTDVWVLGSDPPLEDCYRPDLVPDDAALAAEHAEHCEQLASAGVDAILCETHGCVREARAAARAASQTGLPVLVSFVCWQGATLLSGEPLLAAIRAVRDLEPAALLVNCLPPANVAACLAVLAAETLPFGCYANLGVPDAVTGFRRSDELSPQGFAASAAAWVAAGARVVGGCCGTTPDHIRAIALRLRSGGNG